MKTKKVKFCRICKTGKRVGNLTICYQCFLAKEKVKREARILKLKERKKKRVDNSIPRLRRKADLLFYQAVFKKYGTKCLLCGKPANTVHHFKPKSQYNHLRYCLSNGIPICFDCHFAIEFKDHSLDVEIMRKRGMFWYNKIQEKAKNRPTSFVNRKWYEENIKRLEELE